MKNITHIKKGNLNIMVAKPKKFLKKLFGNRSQEEIIPILRHIEHLLTYANIHEPLETFSTHFSNDFQQNNQIV